MRGSQIIVSENVVFLREKCSKWQALECLVMHAGALTFSERGAAYVALLLREAKGSTSLMPGIAIPHAVVPNLARDTILLGWSRTAIDWGSLDGLGVRLVVAVLAGGELEGERREWYVSWFGFLEAYGNRVVGELEGMSEGREAYLKAHGNHPTGEQKDLPELAATVIRYLALDFSEALPGRARGLSIDGCGGALRVLVVIDPGIHAKPAVKMVQTYVRWKEKRRGAQVLYRYKDVIANPESMMGIMLMAAEEGAVFDVFYSGCGRAEVDEMLGGFCSRSSKEGIDWEADFGRV